ncbi:unnamed protein product [Cochlearia groenlandica]
MVKIEEPDLTQSTTVDRKKNPKSLLTFGSVAQISRAFGLPFSALRIPSVYERPTSDGTEDIVVYESLFSYGFSGIVPSPIATVSRHFDLSPRQLSPMAWRMLMTLEVLGELNSIEVTVASVLYAFYFKPYAGDIGHYHLHPRCNLSLIVNFEVDDQSVSEKSWRRRYLFLSVGPSPNFPTTWSHSGGWLRWGAPFPCLRVSKGGVAAVGKGTAKDTLDSRAESRKVKTSPISIGEVGSSYSLTMVEEMKSKLLSWVLEAIAEDGVGRAANEVYRTLLKVMFSFRGVGEKIAATVEESSKDHEAFVLMREKHDVEKKKGLDLFVAIDTKNKKVEYDFFLDRRYAQMVKAQLKGLLAP